MTDRIWFQKYRIIQSLGQGGSARVYLAEHIKLKTLRAIKQISKENILHEQLLNEAHILKNLNHSCIPVIYDFEEDAQNSYIIEQYIEGESLKVLREQQHKLFNENLIINLAIQICDLFQYLYTLDNPILYLDLKPENIIISGKVVKLIDFGASSFKYQIKDRRYSLGTKGYAAPELYTDRIPDERADIYGIGALLYYMVTGTAYERQQVKNLRMNNLKHCSKPLRHIIHKSLQYNPVLRYSSVHVLKNCLLSINQKSPTGNFNGRNSLSIAIAGTQHRIGTTHLALLITTYLNESGRKAFYLERNDSNHILEVLNRYQSIKTADGYYRLHNCNIIPNYAAGSLSINDKLIVTILDYGCVKECNLEDFKKADIRLIVAGAREWEQEATEDALKRFRGEKNIKFLFNFLDGNQFRSISKYMDQLDSSRIPYEPNLFKYKRSDHLDDFIMNLMNG